eukprot:PhM_4_TR7693/c0_g1_i1/m.46202
MSSFLTSSEAVALLSLLSMSNTPLATVTSSCDSEFSHEHSRARLSLSLRVMMDDGYFTTPTTTAGPKTAARETELLIALHLLAHLRSRGAPAAARALSDYLGGVEDTLRRDAIRKKREVVKGRTTKEHIEHDGYRMHNALKLFTIITVAKRPHGTTLSTARDWLKQDISALDKGFAALAAASTEVTAALKALQDEAAAEVANSVPVGSLRASCASSLAVQGEGTAVSMESKPGTEASRLTAQFARPPPPSGTAAGKLVLTVGDIPMMLMS